MRSGLRLALVMLAAVIALGIGNIKVTKDISRRYVGASQELHALVQAEEWQRAGETAREYHQRWKETLSWLQMLINHADGDEVSYALAQIMAGVEAREAAVCLEGCARMQEAAEHLYHRDAFTLGNIL